MTAHFRFLCFCLVLLCAGTASRAQLTGTKTVPSTSYPTLKVAIDSLNQYGVGTGGVTINFTPATNETAPAGGYRLGSATLNASASATKTVTINGNGNLITAYTGTSTTADGIFYIMGTDYVTIDHLNLTDKTTNTSTTTRMEWGYSLVKLSSTAPYDGCQHVTINGCTITLNGTYTNTMGIRAAHSIAATTTVLSTSAATAASTNSYNDFTGNTISGVTRGISLTGISSPVAVYDKKNEVGGAAANSGNTITVGGATNTCYGVYTQYDSVITIRNNNFHIAGTQGNTAVYEVNLATGVGDITVTGNLFDVNCSTTSAYIYAYWNSGAHRDPASGINALSTHTITGNTITGNNATATSGYLYGIYENTTYCKNLIISNNAIRDINWGNGTGYLYLIYDYLTLTPNQVIDNNNIYNIRKSGTSGYIYGFYLYNYNTPTGHLSMQHNVVRKIKNNSYIYAYYNYASYTAPAHRLRWANSHGQIQRHGQH